MVYMATLVSEICSFLLAFKMAKFPFRTMNIVHGGQKTESAHKFKQVEIDVKCMQTNFGGHDHYGFGNFACFSFAFKMAKFPFQTTDYSSWGSKNRIDSKKSSK